MKEQRRDTKKQGVIFDMDGTLIDSMAFWRKIRFHMCESYRERTGQAVVFTDEETRKIERMSIGGALRYINERHHASITYNDDVKGALFRFYTGECRPKPGAIALVNRLKRDGLPLCVVTATPRELAKAALEHAGFCDDSFKFILTPEQVKGGKFHKPIFAVACLRLFKLPKNTVLIDDAAYAHYTASKLHIRCVGVHDSERNDSLEDVTDCCFDSLKEVLDLYKKNGRL